LNGVFVADFTSGFLTLFGGRSERLLERMEFREQRALDVRCDPDWLPTLKLIVAGSAEVCEIQRLDGNIG